MAEIVLKTDWQEDPETPGVFRPVDPPLPLRNGDSFTITHTIDLESGVLLPFAAGTTTIQGGDPDA